MERSLNQVGVDRRNGTSPPFFQHQFFPATTGNGLQPPQSNIEKTNGHASSAGRNGGVLPRHWDAKSYNWDPVNFSAEPTDGRGEGSSEDQTQVDGTGEGGSRRASGITVDRPSRRRKNGRCNDDDDGENTERSAFDSETPSPPYDDGHGLPEDDDSHDAAGSLSLKLGGDAYAYANGEENGGGARNGKRNRSSSPQYQVPSCQVDGCKADLSRAKDYYRRHKVCEMHSKASKAAVSRLMQRFCQQCSRFHPLGEFDEGKRSCRRRLAGHNRRRRKAQPDADAARAILMAEEERLKGGTGLIGSLLSVLSQQTGATSLVTPPVYDRETLLRKAITASLEDVNRTTPLWAQLLTNPHPLTSALGQQVQQLAASNNHGANAALESQRLLSSLSGPSPEALLLLLQNSVNAQIAAASRTLQSNLGSQVPGVNGNGNVPVASAFGTEAQTVVPGTTQAYVTPTSAMVSQPVRSSPPKEVLRPTPMVPTQMQQQNSEQSVHVGVPALPSMFMQYQATAATSYVPTSSVHPSDALRMPPTSTFMSHHEASGTTDGPSCSAARERETSQRSGGSSQSGSDDQVPSSSNSYVERRNRTRRIAMKLFERSPEELPSNLRFQIDSWLAHLPSDMESYIRPGCLVLTIFVSMPTCGWTELDRNLRGSVQRLLDACDDDFWHRGRILVQVDRQMVLIVDGEIQENGIVNSWSHPYVESVRPLAIEAGETATLTVKGLNLTLPDTRVICAHRGKLLVEESVGSDCNETEADPSHAEEAVIDGSVDQTEDDPDDADEGVTDGIVDRSVECSSLAEDDDTSIVLDAGFTFCGERQHSVGRCFLEVEHDTTLANARPVIIADRLVCAELCTLEEEVDLAASCMTVAAVREGLEPVEALGCRQVTRLIIEEDITCFLHELGWYFQSGGCGQYGGSSIADAACATRLKCLLIFSVERSWCAVVRKLFDITVANENMGSGIGRLSLAVQDDVSLLHRAVRRRNRGMVELLLAYTPFSRASESTTSAGSEQSLVDSMKFKLLWGNVMRSDMSGPGGLTPLHIAASLEDGEDIVDALTSDPWQVGLNAWVNKRDESGQTPLQYAMARNNVRSVQLVRGKLAALEEGRSRQVFIDIPSDAVVQSWAAQRLSSDPRGGCPGPSGVELAGWGDAGSGPLKNASIVKSSGACRIYAPHSQFGGGHKQAFRPFLLSLVAIAAICVCVCVVIRTPPNVQFLTRPFRWEGAEGGRK